MCVQATFASAEVKAKSLAEMQQADAAEVEKLLQRQQAAQAQYDQGLSKLRATARQLQSLASKVCPRVLSCQAGVCKSDSMQRARLVVLLAWTMAFQVCRVLCAQAGRVSQRLVPVSCLTCRICPNSQRQRK